MITRMAIESRYRVQYIVGSGSTWAQRNWIRDRVPIIVNVAAISCNSTIMLKYDVLGLSYRRNRGT